MPDQYTLIKQSPILVIEHWFVSSNVPITLIEQSFRKYMN